MPESLENEFISDLYTSLLHLSGAKLENKLNKIFDGAGNSTGLALSGHRVIVNNYIYPQGYATAVEWLDAFWPVGSIKLTFNDQNPGDYLQPPRNALDDQDPTNFPGIAGTKWDRVGEGRFLVGVGEDEVKGVYADFCPGGKEEEAAGLREGSGDVAGEYEVELEEYHLPAHNHETNTGAQGAQVAADVGSGVLFQGEPLGNVDSTSSFDNQVRARNALLINFVRWDGSRSIGHNGLTVHINTDWEMPAGGNPRGNYSMIYYGLDLGFRRGSSQNYDQDERNKFLSIEGYKSAGGKYGEGDGENWPNFKEMIGIWNGETRFVADLDTIGRRIAVSPGYNTIDEGSNPYMIARRFGAVDYNDAVAGQFLSQNNQMQTLAADQDAIETVSGTTNERESTYTGDNEPHNNIPPSYGVYIWKRTQ